MKCEVRREGVRFYKILRQRATKKESFCNLLDTNNYEYITGKSSNSFAVKYDPETFNQLLNSNAVFKEYNNKSIQQLIVTNQKFLAILNYDYFFNMKMESCMFVEDTDSDYLTDYDEFSAEVVEDIIKRYDFNIKEVVFTTNESKRKILLQKNGVIGIDNGLTTSERYAVEKFIDTLNFGLKVINS